MSATQPVEPVKQFLETADEMVVVAAIEAATQVRQQKGQGTDILDELETKGIKVLTSALEKPFYKSKKFWGGMIALVILIIDAETGRELWKVAAAPLAYVFGQGLADLGKNKE